MLSRESKHRLEYSSTGNRKYRDQRGHAKYQNKQKSNQFQLVVSIPDCAQNGVGATVNSLEFCGMISDQNTVEILHYVILHVPGPMLF